MPADLEIICVFDGTFLGVHGRPLPLPNGWRTWNVFSGRQLVASLAVSTGQPDHVDWGEADYRGPFFHDERPGGAIAVLQCVYIHPVLRGSGLWLEFEQLLAELRRPVYATFANERLGERFRRMHRPNVIA